MTLIKTSLLNGIAVLIKMLTLLGINKVLAVYVGPAGYAALGQFQNAMQMITTVASGAINTGVTKYTAEYGDDKARQYRIWRSAISISFFCSIFAALVIVVFSRQLAVFFLKNEIYQGVFIWFAAALLLLTLNSVLVAILNGKKDIRRYVLANILASLLSLAVTAVLAIAYGLYGALVSLAIYQSLSFFVTLLLCARAPWFRYNYLIGKADTESVKNLSKFALMALTTAICIPVSHVLVRKHLGDTFGWESAGYWEAMWRLSGAYLMLVTTTLSVYYLPRLSELKNANETKIEILQGYKIILPVAVLTGLVIFTLRDRIVAFLFTPEFLPMRELFALQILGDTLKIGGWILAYVIVGRALVKLFIATEIVFSASFVLFTYLFTYYMGFQGVAMAHAVNYFIYWIVMACIVFIMIFKQNGLAGHDAP